MHYYKRHIGDYAKKAGKLSMLEHGAYTLLLDACYDREKFPTKDEAIDWCWARTADEVAAVEFILRKFFIQDNGVFVDQEILEELTSYKANSKINKRIAQEREAKRKEEKARSVHEIARTVNEPPPNHKPLTINQEPKNQNTYVDAKAPTCPHQEIIELYNRVLPELQAVIPDLWDGTRKTHLQARWRESTKHQSLEFWERFFNALRNHDFYLGENDRGWRANLGWMVEKKNFTNLVEKFTSTNKRLNGASHERAIS